MIPHLDDLRRVDEPGERTTISDLRQTAQERRRLRIVLDGETARLDRLVRQLRQGGYTWRQIADAAGEPEDALRVRDQRSRRRLRGGL